MGTQSIPGRILRRCINCGASESDTNPLASKRYEGITMFVCRDTGACARRYVAMQAEQTQESGLVLNTDPWKIEFKPGF